MDIILWIVFGLVVGVVAKFVMPGRYPGGMILTIVLGNLEIAQRHIEVGSGREERFKRVIGSALQAARRAPVLTQRLLAFAHRQKLDSA